MIVVFDYPYTYRIVAKVTKKHDRETKISSSFLLDDEQLLILIF